MDIYVLLILLGLPAVTGGLTLWAADLQRKRADSALARIVGAASRAAGRINETLAGVPIGSSREIVKQAAIAAAVKDIRTEFATSLKRVGGTDDKVAGIVAGELGKLPSLAPTVDAALVREAILAVVPQVLPAAGIAPEALTTIQDRVVELLTSGRAAPATPA